MVVSHYAACHCSILGERLTGIVVSIARSVAIPLPVAERQHTVEGEPRQRFRLEFKLHAHVTGTNACHVHKVLLLIAESSRLSHCLVTPQSVVSIDVGSEPCALETISHLSRIYLLVLGIRVGDVGSGAGHECSISELRRTADDTYVEEHVMISVDIIVGTALYREAEIVYSLRACVFLIVIEAAVTPV